MGYSTDFEGQFNLDKPLTVPQFNYLRAFSETRHMRRDNDQLMNRTDTLRAKVGLPLGVEGEFYVVDDEYAVLDGNQEPATQPGLWCKWVPTEDGEGIEWSGAEKFYDYVEWLEYIIKNFLKPWGLTLNGEVTWEGEDNKDIGKIIVKDNRVTTKKAKITYSVEYEGD
jgi:hypothetical protein